MSTVLLRWVSFGSVAAWMVGRIAGDAWAWSQWLFWIPTITVALPALAALAACTLARVGPWRRDASVQAALAAAALAIGLAQLVGLGGAPSAAPQAVTLLQWNTDWPSGDDMKSVEFLASNLADIVVLSNRGAITSPDMVHAWAGDDAVVVGAGPFALVTRMPVREARQVAVGGKGRQLWWVARFEVEPPAWNGRTLSIAMIDLPSRPSIAKERIAEGLREACESGGLGEVDLVAGDFNATDGSVIIGRCFPGFRDSLALSGRGWTATWPRRFPLWKIDHVLAGPSVATVVACTRDPGVSHHRATVVSVVPAGR